jgi:hypothetical protein
MRRGIAIVITLLFGWLIILPAVAASPESNLPACCRRNGKHHCSMHEKNATQGHAFSAIAEKCPRCPQSGTASPLPFSCSPTLGSAVFAGLVSHPAVSPQTEASYRISYDRSRQKRGPPSLILS